MTHPVSRSFAMVAFGLLCLSTSLPARAESRASCAVRQILGRTEPGGIDPQIKFLSPLLSKPPFTAWKSFKYLNRTDLQMVQDEHKEMLLVTGHKLRLVYLGKEDKQLRMRLTIDPKYLNVTFRIVSGGTVLQIGLPHEGGTVILAITCKG